MSNSVQLEMFKGEVLTEEQQKQVESFIDNQVQTAQSAQEKASTIMLLLDEAGFIYRENYINTIKVKKATKEVTLGCRYNSTNFTTGCSC